MSMEQNLNEFIEELIQEIEQELEEATTTASADGYNTPFAFGAGRKKDKKKEDDIVKSATGYTRVNESKDEVTSQQLLKIQADLRKVNRRIRAKISSHPATKGRLTISIPEDGNWESDTHKVNKVVKKHTGDHRTGIVVYESVNEAIKGRNNKTGETFGMVIGSDKKNREGDFEVTVRKSYSSRIESFKFVFDKNSNLIEVHDYGYSMNGKFPDMGGRSSVKSIRPDKRETITQIAKITSPAFAKKIYQHVQKNNKMNESIDEAKVKRPVNRWLELKNDDTMHPHKKMAMGLKELKYQLKEVEKFFSWYNKIKTMNELDSQNYWKRTNNHIYKIKERLINIAKTIQEIEK